MGKQQGIFSGSHGLKFGRTSKSTYWPMFPEIGLGAKSNLTRSCYKCWPLFDRGACGGEQWIVEVGVMSQDVPIRLAVFFLPLDLIVRSMVSSQEFPKESVEHPIDGQIQRTCPIGLTRAIFTQISVNSTKWAFHLCCLNSPSISPYFCSSNQQTSPHFWIPRISSAVAQKSRSSSPCGCWRD